MGFIKKLFGLEKEEVKQTPQEVKQTPISEIIRAECNICHNPIYMDEKYSKYFGQYYHKSCWKEAKKQTWGS